MSLFAASLLLLAGETGQRTIDNWMVYDGADVDRRSIIFVEKSGLYQRPDGWINFSYQEVRNGSRLNTVKTRIIGTWVNCKTHQFISDYRMEYGTDGKMIQEGKLDEQRRVPAPGSAEARVLAFACGDTSGAVRIPVGTNPIVAANEIYARYHPGMANASAPRVTAGAAAPTAHMPAAAGRAVTAPGLGKANWRIISDNEERMMIYAPATVRRGKDSGQAWFTIIYAQPQNFARVSGTDTVQLLQVANCAQDTMANVQVASYAANGRVLFAESFSNPQSTSPASGTPSRSLLDILCGRPANLPGLPDFNQDVAGMRMVYRSLRQQLDEIVDISNNGH